MDAKRDERPLYSIQVAARRARLRPDVIRVWERRYEAVVPVRTPTGRRLFTNDDVERLRRLADLTRAGHRIGDIAHHPDEVLDSLEDAGRWSGVPSQPAPENALEQVVADGLDAVGQLDGRRLRSLLERAMIGLAPDAFIDRVIVPLLRDIGMWWWSGGGEPGHEHLATTVIRSALMDVVTQRPGIRRAERIVVTTPAAQRHEIGALLVAATAAIEGWAVYYLGADLPAEAIANVMRQTEGDVLAISLIHPPDDPDLPAELRSLKRLAPSRTQILAGGQAAPAYADALDDIGATVLDDLPTLRSWLRWDNDDVWTRRRVASPRQ